MNPNSIEIRNNQSERAVFSGLCSNLELMMGGDIPITVGSGNVVV
jgi:hypothetical protein